MTTKYPNDALVSVPRWALSILHREVAGMTYCGGEFAEPDCPICKAIILARAACDGE